jgi:hypothetical protein
MRHYAKPPPCERYFPSDNLLARSAINASLSRLHDLTCDSLPRMWNAVQKGWAHPQHYAVCVRDHPLGVMEELVRLLSAVHFYWKRKGEESSVRDCGRPQAQRRETSNL